jgi:hypothetical protein
VTTSRSPLAFGCARIRVGLCGDTRVDHPAGGSGELPLGISERRKRERREVSFMDHDVTARRRELDKAPARRRGIRQVKQQHLSDDEVEPRPAKVESTELATANLDHITRQRFDPVVSRSTATPTRETRLGSLATE